MRPLVAIAVAVCFILVVVIIVTVIVGLLLVIRVSLWSDFLSSTGRLSYNIPMSGTATTSIIFIRFYVLERSLR